MVHKIFLLIATFCIAQVKSEAVGYPGDFPNAVLLSDASSLWGNDISKQKCFQDCYTIQSDNHRLAIENFSEQIFAEAKKMKKKFRRKQDFKTLASKIPASAKALGNLFKRYQKKFLELVKKGSFEEFQEFMKRHKNQIGKSDRKLDEDILTLKGRTISAKKKKLKNIVINYEETIQIQQTEVTNACEKIMNSLKQCIKEKSC